MNISNLDPRWIFVLLIVLLYVLRGNPYIDIVILAVGAGWALQAGLSPWRGNMNPIGGSRVTYWRGQRIEIQQPAWERVRSVSPLQVIVSIVYLALGLICAFAALLSFLQLSRIV